MEKLKTALFLCDATHRYNYVILFGIKEKNKYHLEIGRATVRHPASNAHDIIDQIKSIAKSTIVPDVCEEAFTTYTDAYRNLRRLI